MNPRQKRDAKYTAAGVGAGALAMPVRERSNAKVNPFKDLPEGVHNVPIQDMHKIARKTGKRLENRRYTARMAGSVLDGEDHNRLHKPAQVLVRGDGSARQSSGAHRLWAQTMAGEKNTLIEVHHVKGPRTTEPLYRRAAKDAGQAIQQRRLKQGAWKPEKIRSTAAKYSDFSRKFNEKHIGGREDVVNPLKEIGPSTAKLRTKQGVALAAGATAGLAASALRDTDKKTVKKSHTTSAFGVDHGS